MSKTITGTFQNPDGSAVAHGILRLKLSQAANISGTAQIAPTEISIQLDASGAIPASTTLLANDEITPTGTTYYAALFTGQLGVDGSTYQPGGQIWSQQWSISGTSPIDLTKLTATTSNVSLPSPITSIGLTMPAEFSVASSPLTQNGTIAVTKANETANTVFAGPASGGAAAPAFRALVDADIPGTLAGHTLTNPTTTGTDSGTETLKNKTLTGASSGNSVSLLNAQGAAGAITGTGAEVTVFTYSMPGNTLATSKALRVRAHANHSTGTASTTWKLYFGATAVGSGASAVQFNANWEMLVVATGPTAQTCVTSPLTISSTVALGAQAAATTETLSGTIVIKLTMSVANTDQVTPNAFIVELLQ